MLFEREVFEERIRSPRLQRFAVVTSWSWYITIHVFFKQLNYVGMLKPFWHTLLLN